MADTTIWLRTNEREDVAASVRHVLRCWQFIPTDEHIWKWIALALHAALQGACVCHLATTAQPIGIVGEENAERWLHYMMTSREDPVAKPPKTKIMGLPDLLAAVRASNSAGDGSRASGISISSSELDWLRRFHEQIRNQFTHFEPQAWSIDVSGVPDLAALTSRIIGDILSAGWAFRHQDDLWKVALRTDLVSMSRLGAVAQDRQD